MYILKLCRHLIEPISLPFGWIVGIWCVVFAGSLGWLQSITPISDASYCFMDAVMWTDALEGFYFQVPAHDFIWDRPPLSIWAGSWFRHYGYTSTQALQMISRAGLSIMIASISVGLLRRTSLLVTGTMLWTLLGMSVFTKLVIWLNAEMLINGLFVAHLFAGWRAIDDNRCSKQSVWLVLSGILLGAAVCAKEQGLLLAPLSTMMILLSASGFGERLRAVGWYLLGALPFFGWYGYWLKGQFTYGEKWRIFQGDLQVLAKQESWSDVTSVSTTWGSFSRTFGESKSVGDFFISASQSLLQSMWMPLVVISCGLVLSLVLVMLSEDRKQRLRDWGWLVAHLSAAVPLFLVPIFEPYHYTVLWGPAVASLGWVCHRLIARHWSLVIILVAWGSWYQPTVKSLGSGVSLEVAECISGRIRGIRNWARHGLPDDAILYVTSSLVTKDRSLYPQRVYPYSRRMDTCTNREYVLSSEISNQRDLFVADRMENPNEWKPIHQMVGVNQEMWEVYHCE